MAKLDHHSRPLSGGHSFLGPLALITIIVLAMLGAHFLS
jgi:hypothetical protein